MEEFLGAAREFVLGRPNSRAWKDAECVLEGVQQEQHGWSTCMEVLKNCVGNAADRGVAAAITLALQILCHKCEHDWGALSPRERETVGEVAEWVFSEALVGSCVEDVDVCGIARESWGVACTLMARVGLLRGGIWSQLESLSRNLHEVLQELEREAQRRGRKVRVEGGVGLALKGAQCVAEELSVWDMRVSGARPSALFALCAPPDSPSFETPPRDGAIAGEGKSMSQREGFAADDRGRSGGGGGGEGGERVVEVGIGRSGSGGQKEARKVLTQAAMQAQDVVVHLVGVLAGVLVEEEKKESVGEFGDVWGWLFGCIGAWAVCECPGDDGRAIKLSLRDVNHVDGLFEVAANCIFHPQHQIAFASTTMLTNLLSSRLPQATSPAHSEIAILSTRDITATIHLLENITERNVGDSERGEESRGDERKRRVLALSELLGVIADTHCPTTLRGTTVPAVDRVGVLEDCSSAAHALGRALLLVAESTVDEENVEEITATCLDGLIALIRSLDPSSPTTPTSTSSPPPPPPSLLDSCISAGLYFASQARFEFAMAALSKPPTPLPTTLSRQAGSGDSLVTSAAYLSDAFPSSLIHHIRTVAVPEYIPHLEHPQEPVELLKYAWKFASALRATTLALRKTADNLQADPDYSFPPSASSSPFQSPSSSPFTARPFASATPAARPPRRSPSTATSFTTASSTFTTASRLSPPPLAAAPCLEPSLDVEELEMVAQLVAMASSMVVEWEGSGTAGEDDESRGVLVVCAEAVGKEGVALAATLAEVVIALRKREVDVGSAGDGLNQFGWMRCEGLLSWMQRVEVGLEHDVLKHEWAVEFLNDAVTGGASGAGGGGGDGEVDEECNLAAKAGAILGRGVGVIVDKDVWLHAPAEAREWLAASLPEEDVDAVVEMVKESESGGESGREGYVESEALLERVRSLAVSATPALLMGSRAPMPAVWERNGPRAVDPWSAIARMRRRLKSSEMCDAGNGCVGELGVATTLYCTTPPSSSSSSTPPPPLSLVHTCALFEAAADSFSRTFLSTAAPAQLSHCPALPSLSLPTLTLCGYSLGLVCGTCAFVQPAPGHAMSEVVASFLSHLPTPSSPDITLRSGEEGVGLGLIGVVSSLIRAAHVWGADEKLVQEASEGFARAWEASSPPSSPALCHFATCAITSLPSPESFSALLVPLLDYLVSSTHPSIPASSTTSLPLALSALTALCSSTSLSSEAPLADSIVSPTLTLLERALHPVVSGGERRVSGATLSKALVLLRALSDSGSAVEALGSPCEVLAEGVCEVCVEVCGEEGVFRDPPSLGLAVLVSLALLLTEHERVRGGDMVLHQLPRVLSALPCLDAEHERHVAGSVIGHLTAQTLFSTGKGTVIQAAIMVASTATDPFLLRTWHPFSKAVMDAFLHTLSQPDGPLSHLQEEGRDALVNDIHNAFLHAGRDPSSYVSDFAHAIHAILDQLSQEQLRKPDLDRVRARLFQPIAHHA